MRPWAFLRPVEKALQDQDVDAFARTKAWIGKVGAYGTYGLGYVFPTNYKG